MPSTCVRFRIVMSRSPGRQGAIVKPQLPMTAVVTPSDGDGRTRGSQVIWASKWVWLSMMPGISASPSAPMTSRALPASAGPTAAMRPPLTATSAIAGGAPEPSKTDALRMSRSFMTAASQGR